MSSQSEKEENMGDVDDVMDNSPDPIADVATVKQVKKGYKKMKANSATLAAASLAVVPQKLVSLVTFLSTQATSVPHGQTVCFYIFIGVGLTLALLQAILVFVHYLALSILKDRDMKRLDQKHHFPPHQLGYKQALYRLLYWAQVCLITTYTTCFIVSDAILAGLASNDLAAT